MLLFIDTFLHAIAERLGEVRFFDFLNLFITDLSLPIAEAGGEVHQYVGDEVIVSWTLAAGLTRRAACAPALPCSTASPRAAPPTSANSACARFPRRPSLRSGGGRRTRLSQEGDRADRRHHGKAARIQEACRDTVAGARLGGAARTPRHAARRRHAARARPVGDTRQGGGDPGLALEMAAGAREHATIAVAPARARYTTPPRPCNCSRAHRRSSEARNRAIRVR